jgi:hypothetical protein
MKRPIRLIKRLSITRSGFTTSNEAPGVAWDCEVRAAADMPRMEENIEL